MDECGPKWTAVTDIPLLNEDQRAVQLVNIFIVTAFSVDAQFHSLDF